MNHESATENNGVTGTLLSVILGCEIGGRPSYSRAFTSPSNGATTAVQNKEFAGHKLSGTSGNEASQATLNRSRIFNAITFCM